MSSPAEILAALGDCRTILISVHKNPDGDALGSQLGLMMALEKEGKTVFINFITQVSPACDCYGHADAPIVNDIGICASIDPVGIDQACADLVNGARGNEGSALQSGLEPGGDKFRGCWPEIPWEVQLEHGEKVGLGSRKYELVRI
jgi:hypothetical protein